MAGRMPLSGKNRMGKSRKDVIKRIRTRAEIITDQSRMKIFEQRRRYKYKVEQNEERMRILRDNRERNLNPTAVETVPSREYAKMLRNPANLSMLPTKPRYSNAQTTRMRIYGRRFDRVDENPELLTAEISAKKKATGLGQKIKTWEK